MTDNQIISNTKLEIIKASEIIPKEVRWLWYPYIPFGKVTLLQGDPGDGKSKLMLSLAALLSKGEPLPFADEEEHTEPMTVIYQTTEDDADDTVVPRFNSADGDGERLMSLSHIPPPTMGSAPVTLLLTRSVTIAETDTPFSLVPTSSMGVWGWVCLQSGQVPEVLSSEVAV